MHTSLFDIKHAHLAAIRLARGETAEVGLTPARLDMLRAILQAKPNGMLQSTLWRRLDVSAPVVSRMARALEELGFVIRSRCHGDRRQVRIMLTTSGEEALRTIHHRTRIEPFLELKLQAAFGKEPRRFLAGWERALDRLQGRLAEFRSEFGVGCNNPWVMHEDDERFYLADVEGNPNRIGYVPIWYESWGPTPPCYEADHPAALR